MRTQIFDALESTPDTDFGLSGAIERITTQSPGNTLDQDTVASLYLYHVDIDPHLRNQFQLPDRSRDDQLLHPPLPLQLRYLFTPVTSDEGVNQLLMGRVLQHFHDAPSFGSVSGTPIGDSLGGASPELRVKPDLLSLEQLSQMWNAFSQPYRIALSLMVEVVALDSGRLPARTGRTLTVMTAVGEGR